MWFCFMSQTVNHLCIIRCVALFGGWYFAGQSYGVQVCDATDAQ